MIIWVLTFQICEKDVSMKWHSSPNSFVTILCFPQNSLWRHRQGFRIFFIKSTIALVKYALMNFQFKNFQSNFLHLKCHHVLTKKIKIHHQKKKFFFCQGVLSDNGDSYGSTGKEVIEWSKNFAHICFKNTFY